MEKIGLTAVDRRQRTDRFCNPAGKVLDDQAERHGQQQELLVDTAHHDDIVGGRFHSDESGNVVELQKQQSHDAVDQRQQLGYI